MTVLKHAALVLDAGVVSTDRAWCFRFRVPPDATQWTVMRPYWTNRDGELTDDDIRSELTRIGLGHLADQCIATCPMMAT